MSIFLFLTFFRLLYEKRMVRGGDITPSSLSLGLRPTYSLGPNFLSAALLTILFLFQAAQP